MSDPFSELIPIHPTFQKLVYVGLLVRSSKQVEEPPQIDRAI